MSLCGRFHSPLHNDEEALLCVVRVFVDVDDIDDVLAAARPPVEVDLAARLRIVLQHLERVLAARLSVGALHHFSGDAEAEDVVRDRVVVGKGAALDGQRGPRSAYERHEQLVNRLEPLPRALVPLAAAAAAEAEAATHRGGGHTARNHFFTRNEQVKRVAKQQRRER